MMLGLGEDVYDPYTGTWIGSGGVSPVPAGGGGGAWGGWSWLTDLTRMTGAIVGSQVQKPTYETHTTPSGSSTIIRTGGGVMNYPGGGAGPTSVPVAGISTTTMLLLGAAAMMMLVLAKR